MKPVRFVLSAVLFHVDNSVLNIELKKRYFSSLKIGITGNIISAQEKANMTRR